MAKQHVIKDIPVYVSNKKNYKWLDTAEKVKLLITLLRESEINAPVSLDTETWNAPFSEFRSRNVISKYINGAPNNMPFGISMFFNGMGYWITGYDNMRLLKQLFADKSRAWILHNAKYDMNMLLNMGMSLDGVIWDTMIMIQLIDEEMMCKTPEGKMKRSKKLKDLAFHFLGKGAHEYEDKVKELRAILAHNKMVHIDDISYKEANDASPELMKDYACYDTEACYDLFPILYEALVSQELLQAYLVDIAATRAVVGIEREGVRVDQALIESDGEKLRFIIKSLEDEMFESIGKEFKIDGEELVTVAYAKLGIEWKWFTSNEGKADDAKEEYQTTAHIIEMLMREYPFDYLITFSTALLTYRKAKKLLSTYVDGIIPYIQRGKVHCDYWISPDDYGSGGTKTGRMSSSNPKILGRIA